MKKINAKLLARLKVLEAVANRSNSYSGGNEYLQRLRTEWGAPLSGWTDEEIMDLDEAVTKAGEQCGEFDSVAEAIDAAVDLAAEFAKHPKVQHWLKPKSQLAGKVKVEEAE